MKRAERQPNFLSQSVLQFIKKKELIRPGQHVIVAVSGGIDSMVLLDILANLRGILKIELSVAHVNHGLRGPASAADEVFVEKKAAEYRISCWTTSVAAKESAVKRKISLQEAARELRYEFFDNLKKSLKADLIATAHNANDNAETMLFNFLRGSGLQGLSGIPLHQRSVIRPLIIASRPEIEEYAKQNNILFREDASNAKEIYTRNLIRKKVIPLIEEKINPAVVQTLRKESEIFTSLQAFIIAATENAAKRIIAGSTIRLKEFTKVHPFLQLSVVKSLLEGMNIEPSFSIIETVSALANNQKGAVVEISNSLIAERTSDAIVIGRRRMNEDFHFTIDAPSTVHHDAFTISVRPAKSQNIGTKSSSKEYVDAEKIQFPLTVRTWKPGDVFYPLGMNGRKKLSDFFGEQKLTQQQKSEIPVVLSGDSVVWIAGLRLDDRCKITNTTRSFYTLSIKFHDKKNHRRQ